jgi:hypothetical protein
LQALARPWIHDWTTLPSITCTRSTTPSIHTPLSTPAVGAGEQDDEQTGQGRPDVRDVGPKRVSIKIVGDLRYAEHERPKGDERGVDRRPA